MSNAHPKNSIYIAYCYPTSRYIGYAIYDDLRSDGYRVFIDLEEANDRELNQSQILAACHFLLVLVPGSDILCGDELHNELQFAIQHKRHIIPFIVGGADVREYYQEKNDVLPELTWFKPLSLLLSNMDDGLDALRTRLANADTLIIEQTTPSNQLDERLHHKRRVAETFPAPTIKQLFSEMQARKSYIADIIPEPEPEPEPDTRPRIPPTQNERLLDNFTRSTQNFPHMPFGYVNRAKIYEKMGELENALADTERAYKLAPDDVDIRLMRTTLKRKIRLANDPNPLPESEPEPPPQQPERPVPQLAYWQRQVENYTRSIASFPNRAFGYIKRAEVYEKLGEHDKAIADLQRALELTPNDVSIHETLALLQAQTNDDTTT